MSKKTEAVYLHVMKDAQNKMQQAFIDHDGDDSTLKLLLAIWEIKMMFYGVVPMDAVNANSSGKRKPVPATYGKNIDSDGASEPRIGRIAAYVQQPCRPWLDQKFPCADPNDACNGASAEEKLIFEPLLTRGKVSGTKNPSDAFHSESSHGTLMLKQRKVHDS